MANPDHEIILWNLVAAAFAAVIALLTAFFAWRTVEYAKDASAKLQKTVQGLTDVAGLQRESISAAERIQKLEILLRQIEACGHV
jgi:hypothetical protein